MIQGMKSTPGLSLCAVTRSLLRGLLAGTLLFTSGGCSRETAQATNASPGVTLDPASMAGVRERVSKIVSSAPPGAMKNTGLAGVSGGTRLKLLKTGDHGLFICIPQMADEQVPVVYGVTTTPPEVAREIRLKKRDAENVVVEIRLNGRQDQEVQVQWSAVVLLGAAPGSTNSVSPLPFALATGCVQADAPQVKSLADKQWPADGKAEAFCRSIQEFVRSMKQKKQFRSMDAVGILESGNNFICTANANLGCALLRARSIPARTVAVVPPIGQRLEMHRVVEFFEGGRWQKFDPSSLQPDIPMKPWQNVIVAKTTVADEQRAMKPRMGVAVGCPFGQELEFLDGLATFWGSEFYWSMAVPIAEFPVSDAVAQAARKEWTNFLETGRLSPAQLKGAEARDGAALAEAFQAK